MLKEYFTGRHGVTHVNRARSSKLSEKEAIYRVAAVVENNQPRTAIQQLENLCTSSEDAATIYYAWCYLMNLYDGIGDKQRMWKAADEAWRMRPSDHLINILISTTAIENGDHEKAMAHLVFCDQADGEVWFEIGCCLEGQGRLAQSKHAFEKGYAITPEPRFLTSLSRLRDKMRTEL